VPRFIRKTEVPGAHAQSTAARWIALSRIEGLGCVTFKSLSDHFGDATGALFASRQQLEAVNGVAAGVIERLVGFSNWVEVELELRRVLAAGARVVPYCDPAYPPRLRTIADPPMVLYVKGDLHPENEKAVAVVGSRSASEYGRRMASELARGLVSYGFTVVSGMARGIDGAAHEAALEAGGRTIAVLGCGVDRAYPPEHEPLYRRIIQQGAVVSELPIGTRPAAFNFPARNRVISGLSAGVVVVEATEKSGSLITAALALDQGREVFGVPGEAGASRSRGTHRLIRNGAKLVETVEDIVEEIAPQLPRMPRSQPAERALPGNVPPETRAILALARNGSTHVDEIIAQTGLPAAKVAEVLLRLELGGFIRQLPGNRYVAA
jgi:DNA processing protein